MAQLSKEELDLGLVDKLYQNVIETGRIVRRLFVHVLDGARTEGRWFVHRHRFLCKTWVDLDRG